MGLDDVAGEHHVLVRDVDDDVARGMGAAELDEVDPSAAEIHRHALPERRRRPGQAGNAFVPLEQSRKALEFAVPILLSAFGHHRARGLAHDHLLGGERRGPEDADCVVVRQRDMRDRLVRHATHALDHLLRQARRRLGLDHHHRVVADDDARIRIAFGGEGV